jgi:hypothetical protein
LLIWVRPEMKLTPEAVMGELIEFYVPASFNYSRQKWIPESARGKVIAFRMAAKSA